MLVRATYTVKHTHTHAVHIYGYILRYMVRDSVWKYVEKRRYTSPRRTRSKQRICIFLFQHVLPGLFIRVYVWEHKMYKCVHTSAHRRMYCLILKLEAGG